MKNQALKPKVTSALMSYLRKNRIVKRFNEKWRIDPSRAKYEIDSFSVAFLWDAGVARTDDGWGEEVLFWARHEENFKKHMPMED